MGERPASLLSNETTLFTAAANVLLENSAMCFSIRECPRLAPLRHADLPRECPLMGCRTDNHNGAFDPQRSAPGKLIPSAQVMRCAKAFVPIDGTIGIVQKNAKHFPTL
jgi:hypothetical protein